MELTEPHESCPKYVVRPWHVIASGLVEAIALLLVSVSQVSTTVNLGYNESQYKESRVMLLVADISDFSVI